jgi:transposase-like protein
MTATAITSLGAVTEVPEKARRRTYTVEYKLQIVKEADACKEPGEIGALLRREGLYSSHLTTWRQARDRGELARGAAAKKRGPKSAPRDDRDRRIAELERENAKLTTRAERAEAIAEIQKKWPHCWDVRSRARNRDGNRRAPRAEIRRRAPVPCAGRVASDVLPAPRGQGAGTVADAGSSAHRCRTCAIIFDVIDGPRSACMASCPGSIPCRRQASSMSFFARVALSAWATIQPTT